MHKSLSFPELGMAPAMSVLMLLAACGGGDGGGDSPQAPAEIPPVTVPSPPPAVTAPLTTMPASSYSGTRLEAFTRLNEARLAAGVGALMQNAELDAAEQVHSNYLTSNYITGHGENSSLPGFSSETPADRATLYGYKGTLVTELLTAVYEDMSGAAHVDQHLNSVYHLHGALNPRANQLGIGLNSTTTPGKYVASGFSLGATESNLMPLGATWIWPAEGASDVPRYFLPATEQPNPLPDLAATQSIKVGAPVMFCGAKGHYAALNVSAIRFSTQGSEQTQNIRLLRHSDVAVSDIPGIENVVDPNIVTLFPSMKNCIILISKPPLQANTQYEVSVKASQAGEDISRTWNFTTGS